MSVRESNIELRAQIYLKETQGKLKFNLYKENRTARLTVRLKCQFSILHILFLTTLENFQFNEYIDDDYLN